MGVSMSSVMCWCGFEYGVLHEACCQREDPFSLWGPVEAKRMSVTLGLWSCVVACIRIVRVIRTIPVDDLNILALLHTTSCCGRMPGGVCVANPVLVVGAFSIRLLQVAFT
jgi:hypothetical protein